jgi:hypothetical protein
LLPDEIAFLDEDESAFGSNFYNYGGIQEKYTPRGKQGYSISEWFEGSWNLHFPRDISSLRTTYEKQGIFDNMSVVQPWKHFLNLKSDEQGDGDTVKSFGGMNTAASEEEVLLGISEFLKSHDVRAVVISATNQADSYFLCQFFHANNSSLRTVILGSSRQFLRGATAQFRGDMVVDDFPMMPRLHDWTGSMLARNLAQPDPNTAYVERIFSSGIAQGSYMAALDLVAQPDEPNPKAGQPGEPNLLYRQYPEYSTPPWANNKTKDQSKENAAADASPLEKYANRPPVYLSLLGSGSPWPLDLRLDPQLERSGQSATDPAQANRKNGAEKVATWKLEMPFTLFRYSGGKLNPAAAKGYAPNCSRFWIILFFAVNLAVLFYGICFWLGNPIKWRSFASFTPRGQLDFWIYVVSIPALISGLAFVVLAWPIVNLAEISPDASFWLRCAVAAIFIAPLVVALPAAARGWRLQSEEPYRRQGYLRGMAISLAVPIPVLFAAYCTMLWFCARQNAYRNPVGVLLNDYREMHWESGLSLLPTWLLLLAAFLVWSRGAGLASSLCCGVPALPHYPNDNHISRKQGKAIRRLMRPFPMNRQALLLWRAWAACVALSALCFFFLPTFRTVTTLEGKGTTWLLMRAIFVLNALMLFDLLHFVFLWCKLRDLLRGLSLRNFRRSFVPIRDFPWPDIWSFSGVSFYDQRIVLAKQLECAFRFAQAPFTIQVARPVGKLWEIRRRYRTGGERISISQYRTDLRKTYRLLARIGTRIAEYPDSNYYPPPHELRESVEAIRTALACQCDKDARFSDEGEQVTRLEDWQQDAERFLCLLYISFMRSIIARLHSMMFTVAAVFSLICVAAAIYPFAPMAPLFLSGVVLLGAIAWSFYVVFSQMDTDPILSRIVNGDDRKLQWNFYGKFAESLALPLLTLASSLLPGGASRILDVLQTLLEHGSN